MTTRGIGYEQFRPGTLGFEQGALLLGSHWDEQQRVEIVGVKRAASNAEAWDVRFRASRACRYVRVHIQSDGTGGRDYSAGSSVSSTQYDMRQDRQRTVEISAPQARYIFLVPEFEEGDGTFTKYDGSDGTDHLAYLELGPAAGNIATITSNDTLDETDETVLVDASGGAVTVTLPAAASYEGKRYDIKKIDSSGNLVTVDGNSSETIDDSLTKVLSYQYDAIRIKSDGTEWWIL